MPSLKTAIGIPQIRKDTIFFRAGDETWEFPAYEMLGAKGIAHFDGCTYVAKVKDLRKFAKENKNG